MISNDSKFGEKCNKNNFVNESPHSPPLTQYNYTHPTTLVKGYWTNLCSMSHVQVIYNSTFLN